MQSVGMVIRIALNFFLQLNLSVNRRLIIGHWRGSGRVRYLFCLLLRCLYASFIIFDEGSLPPEWDPPVEYPWQTDRPWRQHS